MKVTIDNLHTIGQVADQPGWQIPKEAWTSLSNVRIDNRQVKTVDGYGVFKSLSGETTDDPLYILAAADETDYHYIYPGVDSISRYSPGGSIVDVTGTTPTGATTDRWNGGVLNGLPILNNNVNPPQYLADFQAATNFANLTGWDANWKAKVVRVYKNFIFALYLTESSTAYPWKIRWSTSAAVSGIPSSWTAATTNDAGSTSLAETPGWLVDMVTLGDNVIIYKSDSAWMCQYIGGDAVFRFARVKAIPGMLTQDCGREFRGGQFVVGTNDVYVTDGQQIKSVIDNMNRDALFDAIDSTNYLNTFVYHNDKREEMWICYPAVGSTWANKAFVWCYTNNTWSTRDLPSATVMMTSGAVNSNTLAWNALTWSTWTNWEGQWGTAAYSPVEIYPVAPSGNALYQFEYGNQANAVNQLCVAEKKSFSIGNRDDIYRISAVYPMCENGPVNIYVGTQMFPNQIVTYEGPYAFDPTTDQKIDVRATGRLHSIKFTSNANVNWAVNSFEMDVIKAGSR